MRALCHHGLLILIAVCGACGGKPRVVAAPPASAPAGAPAGRAVDVPTNAGGAHSVRILIQQDLTQVEVLGANRAERLWIEVRGKELILRPVSGETSSIERGSGFRLEPAPGRALSVRGRSYRGALEAFINPIGVPVLVNEVDLEDYLRGVVPNELGPRAFPYLEALKAQAVAARTFAVRHLGEQASRGFDLFDDSRSQVYAGRASEQTLSDEAVSRTQGVVARYGGEPIWALYSSTCGGVTEDFQYAFTGPSPPYLRGGATCDDQRSRYFRWEEAFSGSEVSRQLARWGDVGAIEDIEVVERSPAGRIVELAVAGRRGNLQMSGPEFRRALGLRSTAVDRLTVHRRGGEIDRLEVEGRGWGHGVGLCQIGAVDLASRGAGYDAILTHYYPGIELSSLR